MARFVVTGGAGFIGSHLCQRLVAEGHRVVAIDNLLTGSLRNVEAIPPERFSLIQHDVTKHIEVEGPVDYVLHLASPASPVDYEHFPIQTLKVGSLGTHNALGLAKEKGAVFFLASTSEVYGDPLEHPQTEEYWGNVNPIGERSMYDEAKRFGEAITMAYHRSHGVAVRIARIFNTYGPRMRLHDGRVVPNFIYQALTGAPLTVFGTGEQTRSFCYVDDLVEGILRLVRSGSTGPVNLGNPREFTVREFAQMVLSQTGSASEVRTLPAKPDDPRRRRPDITKASEILDWRPVVELRDGLARTIADIRARIEGGAG
jgi:dTDP-glucose 4,6-dehydratase